MKSRVKLDPLQKRAIHSYVDQQMFIERAYIAQLCITAGALALHEEFGFGAERVQRWAAAAYDTMERYFDADPNTWPDMAQRDCESAGIPFDGEWVKARDREPLKRTPEQEEYIRKSRDLLVSDDEAKKLFNEGWKVWKG